MFLSVSDIFKIGIGPSSSHTMGPMTAANRFLDEILNGEWIRPSGCQIKSIKVSLHGSLAFTGVGHGTDRAVFLGLMGFAPDRIDPDQIDEKLNELNISREIQPEKHPAYNFDPKTDLEFDRKTPLSGHANGMIMSGFDQNNRLLLKRVYYSIGGGFVVTDTELETVKAQMKPEVLHNVPYPFSSADQMLAMAKQSGLSIADMKRANEEKLTNKTTLDNQLDNIWQAMNSCIERGLKRQGIMPGGLNVSRRASKIHQQLQKEWTQNSANPMLSNDWLCVYAMAVNEENASGGRIVTAPTNGAAGVIPAVIAYMAEFLQGANTKRSIQDFLLTAAAIGGLIKSNASISGAEVGCQGEVGSASSMAAAGLAAIMGGTPEQIENAAEIALEHHLGMTCDPIGGLVQVPCIERNGVGAVKAAMAASLAMRGDGQHLVSLDNCIETMRQTGHDMNARYKETSQGGLAVNVVEC